MLLNITLKVPAWNQLTLFKNVGTVTPVFNNHSKLDKIQILMTNGSLMKVKSICSIIGAFCNSNTFDLH